MTSPRDDYNDLTGRGRGRKYRHAREIEFVLRGGVSEIVRRLQLRVWQVLTLAHPVDTGFSRGQWTPTVGSPIADRRDRPAERSTASSQGSLGLSSNRARAEQVAKSYQLEQGRVFLTNPVPYVVFLNQGSSAQAPAKFVERSIERAIRSIA